MKDNKSALLGLLATAIAALLIADFRVQSEPNGSGAPNLGGSSIGLQDSGKARPFKETGFITFNPDGFTFGVIGSATHLGEFVGHGTYEVTGVSDGGLKVHFHVAATWTAANGDSIDIDIADWVSDYTVNPPTSTGVTEVIGGTGRFANASGTFLGEISPPDVTPGIPNVLTSEGSISY